MTGDCETCRGLGWLRADGDWVQCAECRGSGETPLRVTGGLTRDGRKIYGTMPAYFPAKPKPRLEPA